MNQIELLKQSLVQLLSLLGSISSLHYRTLLCFVHCDDDILAQPLQKLIQSIGNDELKELVAVSQIPTRNIEQRKREASHEGVRNLSNEIISTFGALFRLTVLQELFKECLTVDHLMVLFDHIPRVLPDQQLIVLQQLQQLFHNMSDWDVANLHARVQEADADSLQEIFPLPPDMCMLFRPLKGLFQLPIDQIIQFHQRFPKFPPLQLVQLVRLMQLQPLEILEMRQVLTEGWEGLQSLVDDFQLEPMDTDVLEGGTAGELSSAQYQLQVVEQPPHQTVYKRNLKPNPELILYGEDDRGSLREGECLVVVPVLYRCDTQEAMPKRLQGDDPMEICVGSSVQFRRLKVQVTTHQTDESLFYIRFELRKVLSGNPSGEYELLTFVQSNPILVVSHSTLIKGPTTILPTIEEVIPCEGTPAGGSRVVIIGSNFMESPASRVAFDGIAVMPEYHGPGTLLCQTPPHPPAVVAVNTSNDGKKWSTMTAPFRYGEEESEAGPSVGTTVPSGHDGNDEDVVMKAILEGDTAILKAALSGQLPTLSAQLDMYGYNAMHYATACCSHSPQLLLQVLSSLVQAGGTFSVRDRRGNTPLHWLLLFGEKDCIVPIIQRCPPTVCALPNMDGITIAHIAAALNMADVLALLYSKGVSLASKTLDGITPMHLSATVGATECLQLALRMQRDLVTCVDTYGESPLHYAVREDCTESIRVLIKYGAPVNTQSSSLESPLQLACSVGHLSSVNALLSADVNHRIDLSLRDESGATALVAALSAGAEEIASLILAHCSAMGSAESLRQQIDVNAVDSFGRSSLTIATQMQNSALVVKLKEFGAVDGKAKEIASDSFGLSSSSLSLSAFFPALLSQSSNRAVCA